MPLPVALATFAACGSLVTSVKSGWELSRMIRKKMEAKQAEEDARPIYRSLRKASHYGLMSEAEYDRWYEKFLAAKAEKDLPGLRKIRAHIRTLYEGAVSDRRRSRSRSRGPGSNPGSTHRREDGKRRQPARLDTYRYALPRVPEPPQRHQDIEWPRSAGSIEYFPLSEKGKTDGVGGVRLARLQRSSSVSYQSGSSPDGSSKTRVKRGVSSSRQERGRSRRRKGSDEDDDDDDSSYVTNNEKREHRGARR